MGIRGGLFVFLVFGSVGIFGLGVCARAIAGDDAEPTALRSRAFRLRHLSNADAKASLEALQIGAGIDLLPHNSLIVTAKDTNDLIRASNLLTLTDSTARYRMEAVFDWPGGMLPSSDQISSRGGLGAVGTLLEPPSGIEGIIIDLYKGKVIVAAPASSFDRARGIFEAMVGLSTAAGPADTHSAEMAASPEAASARVRVGPPAPAAMKAVETAQSTAPKREIAAISHGKSGGLLSVWGPAVASAQTTLNPIGAPLAAEVEVDTAGEEMEPNALQLEQADEEAVAEDDAEDADAVEDVDAAVGQSEEEAVEEDADADPLAGVSEEARNDAALMELVKLLQQSAAEEQDAAKEAAAQQTAEEAAQETQTAAAETTARPEEKTTALPAATLPTRPPLPAPKTASAARTPPQTATAPAKIEARADAGLNLDDIPVTERELQTVIVLPEKVEILALIEMVGKQLGLNYMFDPKQVAGEVMLKIHDGKIKVKEMYALLESVLRFRDLAMVRRGSLVTIVPIAQAAQYDPVLWRDGSELEPGHVIATTIYQLKNIDTGTAQQMLTNMKLGVTFNAVEETQTLIVTDYAYRMSRIEEVLKLVDVKGKTRKYHSRKLEYLTPSEMAAKVQAIAEQMGTLSITVSQTVTTAPAAPTPATPTPGRAAPTPAVRVPTPVRPAPTARSGGDSGVYIETDDRTNRILMVGLEEDIETVNMIIDSLDVEKYGLKLIREYPMQYVEATDVLDTLYELGVISSQPTARTSTLPSRAGAATPRTATAAAVRTPVTTPAGTYTPTANEPQISVRLSTNSLLVNASTEHHREIEMVIRFVDVEQQDVRTVQEYEIQYVDIQEVVSALGELGIIEQQGASTATARRTSAPTPAPGRLPTAAAGAAATAEGPAPTVTFEASTGAEITSQRPQIAVLESTNSLLVYATPKQHETISLVVAHVDRELKSTTTPYVVYALENQDPEELAATLNEIIQATVRDAARSPQDKIQTGAAAGAAASAAVPPKRERNEIQIVADPKSYSLIVYADKKNQQWISDLIKELDAYRPQVHLDVTLVEISKDNQFKFDLDLVTKLPGFAAGGSMQAITALVDPFPKGQVAEGASRGGTGVAFFSDKHIQALLEIMDSKNYGRVLARPSLLVKDNQPGEIKAEKTIYVAQQKTTTVPSTSENYLPITDVSFQDYTSGVTLSITPHIASDKILQLEITLDRTDFVLGTGETSIGETKYPKPLDTVSSNLGTWAVLPDGATIILGGIESVTQNKSVTKVPILGDIPIIGGLFRGVEDTDLQSRLYVFVKATILRPSDDLTGISDIERVSRKKREAFERDEAKFQGLEGVLPGVKPKPLAPERILEDDEYIEQLKARREEEPVSVEVKLDSVTVDLTEPMQSSPPNHLDDRY